MTVLDSISAWTIPVLLAGIVVFGYVRGVKVYEAFVEGAAEAVQLAVRIVPYLVAIFVAVGLFRESGALELTTRLLKPLLDVCGVPGEVLPLMIIRPLSGGGALGVTAELIGNHGPDSFVGRLASIMQGSTDTTFFILTFYFGSVGIKRIRHAMTVGLLADAAGFAAAIYVCHRVFGD